MNPSAAEIAYTSLLRLLPEWSLDPLDSLIASRAYSILRTFRTLATGISRGIVQKAVDDAEGLEEKDIVGILGEASSYH